MRTSGFYRIPVMPARIKALVLAQLGFFQIVWHRIGELNLQLLQRRFTTGLQAKYVAVVLRMTAQAPNQAAVRCSLA